MFNLFSSFDLFFFNFPLMSLIFFMLIFLNFWIINFKMMLSKMLYKFMFNSFVMLKNKKFNKMMMIYMMIFMLFVFYMNFFGSIPYNIPLTSQASVVLMFCMMNWLMINMFLFFNLYKSFLVHCIPEGTPIMMIFFLFIIEIISNLIRPLTLMLRLMGNIIAGHIFINLIFSLMMNMGSCFFLLYLFYMSVELFIGFLQAYIMSTLIMMYYSDL
nr:ATP synthase F0 subunit 6 [Nothopoda sp.]